MLPLASFIDIVGAIGQKTLDRMTRICNYGDDTAATLCGAMIHQPCPANCDDLQVRAQPCLPAAAFCGTVHM